MSEMSYQLSQLTAMNNRLTSDETMYKMICESSSDAYVYFEYLIHENSPNHGWQREK